MQAIAPVVAADFLGVYQKMLYKFEIYNDSSVWINLCSLAGVSYLKSVTIQLGGAGMTADPISGTWSAEFDNRNGIFHPHHVESDYHTYFRIGRKVRISIGANYGGTDYYWQRLIGWMDAPRFNHATRTVSVSGCDYMKVLADTKLGGSVTSPDNYWGDVATFDSVASPTGSGTELYDEADACEIGAHEANNVTNWTDSGSGETVSSVASTKSNYALSLARDAIGPTAQYAHNANVGTVVAGADYTVSFWAKIATGTNYARLIAYQTAGGSPSQIAQCNISVNENAWTKYSFIIKPTVGGALQLRLDTGGKYATATDVAHLDEVSVLLYNPDTWMKYDLPYATCNGPYYVVLDGAPVWQGPEEDPEPGKPVEPAWHYDEDTKSLYFSKGMVINAGSDNLLIYYYTDQSVVDIVADILVACGLYASRALALAGMSYTDPSVTIGRAWVEAGTTALEAMRIICERCNYRFWFAYNGTPTFKPAPVTGASLFDFLDYGYIADLSDYQDLSMIKNHIVIEGIDQAMYQTRSDKRDSRLTATAEDATSIATYLEKTETITNHFFQTQAACDAAVAARLAAYKDPKLYANMKLAYCPVPLEVGDVIQWRTDLDFGTSGALYHTFHYGDGTKYGGAAIYTDTKGIVRDISISNGEATYKCEIV